MAERPVFIPTGERNHLVEEVQVDFDWNPGFASAQKKKNVIALHKSAKKKGLSPLLEVSTKSEDLLGIKLSAFNLKIETGEIGEISLEAAYQGSKVFQNGGPYTNIYKRDSWSAKKDPRVRESGELTHFDYFRQKWPSMPKTAFYDWLYLSALRPHQEFLEDKLGYYKGFTDIEFNPKKSINCQAHSCALLVSLLKLNLLDEALRSQDAFIEITSPDSLEQGHSTEHRQQRLPM